MGKLNTSKDRERAIGMLEAGSTQKVVAEKFGVSVRSVKTWWKNHKDGKSMDIQPGRGRKSKLSKVAKIVISKSLTKRGHSTRKLAAKLTSKGHETTHMTVWRHMRKNLDLVPFKPQIQPKMTEAQKAKRLQFCLERKHWTIDDWKNMLISDESSFELFHPPNRQNDRVWAHNKEEVKPTPTVKFPTKVMVWGCFSFQALSDLHIVPPKVTINSKYYIEEILEKTLLPAMKRRRSTGSVLEKKFMPDISKAIFQQDGAPCHTSKMTLDWMQKHLNSYWGKGVWPGNSPDLSPIENL